MIQLIRI